jgi:YidC/Oxa1 family membrane protein insertase
MIAVGVPLMVLAGAATFLAMWLSQRRHTAVDANPQMATVTRALMYLAPVGVLISGSFFPVPIAVLVYFLAHNVWTLGQQHVLTNVVERAAAREEATLVRPKVVAPRPGQKPKRR